jgi:PilZ domain
VSVPATIRSNARTGAELQGETVNVSEQGIAVTTQIPLEPGTHVSVRFTIPGQIHEFSAESKVCWYDPAKARAGLHFLSLSPKHKSTLQDWLGKKLEEVLPQSVIGRFH